MKHMRIICLVVLFVALLGGCGAKQEMETDIEKINLEETYPQAPGQLETVYTDISDILDDAEAVVEISVVNSHVEMLDGYPQTHTEVEITNVYKGDLQAGEVVNVIEEGGQDGIIMGGLPQLSSDNSYILCLIEYKNNYYICGAFQGRFIEREGYVFQQATEDVKLQKYAPLKLGDFEKMLTDTIDEIV